MTINIRKIRSADAAEVARLSGQLGYSMSVDKTKYQIGLVNNSSNDVGLVAVDGDVIVGWIHGFYSIRLETSPFCEIGGLVVGEQYRGLGIGRILVEQVREWCVGKGCSALRVRSNSNRTDAHRFYENLGFEQVKQQNVFEQKSEDCTSYDA